MQQPRDYPPKTKEGTADYEYYANNPLIERRRPKIEEFKDDPEYEINREKLQNLEKKIEKLYAEKEEAGVRESKETILKQKAFENFIIVEAKKLFGENVEAVPTSHFDDVIKKMDLILEIKEGEKINRLGIDVSLSDIAEFVQMKTNDNKGRIDSHQTGISYFKSVLEPGLKGKLENVPRAVIAIPKEQLGAVLASTKNEKGKLKDVQSYMLGAMRSQLESEFAYAAELNESKIRVENITKAKEGSTLRLRHKEQEVVDNFYNSIKTISSKGSWKEIPKLIKLFEGSPIFRKENVVDPRYRGILLNIASSLSWIYSKEKEIIDQSEKKETAPFGGTVADEVLSHWKPDDFRI